MRNTKGPLVVVMLVLFLVINASAVNVQGQELAGGAKLDGDRAYIFSELKLWILSLELGMGSPLESNFSTFDYSLAGKVYPLAMGNVLPYAGGSVRYTSEGVYEQFEALTGLQLNLPTGIPLSGFGGAGFVFTESGDYTGFTLHFGIKYRFAFY
ncbi:MAG: hypothetical protein ACOC88_01480 [Candidatus Bipolaricaulota bacterium]